MFLIGLLILSLSLNSKILQLKPSFLNCFATYAIAPESFGVTLGNLISSFANFS